MIDLLLFEKRHVLRDLGMSNLDNEIDEGLEDALRAEPEQAIAQHSARNFCGYVWYEKASECFVEQIWQWGAPVAEYRDSEGLKDLMTTVNDNHGWE